MFQEEFTAVSKAALSKSNLLKKNPLGYFLLSMLAGAYIGFGVLLSNTVGAYLDGSPFTKMMLGATFGIALSLVVMAGAELFTGNNLVMSAGILKKTVTMGDAVKLWCICWIGNLVGSFVLGAIFHFSELDNSVVGEFMRNASAAKMSAAPMALIARGMLCNMLVCIATWCGTKLKSESAKLIIIFWCLFAFVSSGFEHSIANMTLFAVVLLRPAEAAVSFGGAAYNLILVTIGNMIGGIVLVALPYFAASKEK